MAGKISAVRPDWPEELDLPIAAVVPEEALDPLKYDVSQKMQNLPSGVILATRSRLKVGDFDETVPVKSDAKSISFQVALPTGPVHLQTWLTDATGKLWGAYYVYVERL